jgi:hypothetical protein
MPLSWATMNTHVVHPWKLRRLQSRLRILWRQWTDRFCINTSVSQLKPSKQTCLGRSISGCASLNHHKHQKWRVRQGLHDQIETPRWVQRGLRASVRTISLHTSAPRTHARQTLLQQNLYRTNANTRKLSETWIRSSSFLSIDWKSVSFRSTFCLVNRSYLQEIRHSTATHTYAPPTVRCKQLSISPFGERAVRYSLFNAERLIKTSRNEPFKN